MLRFALLCTSFFVVACEPNGLYESSDGETYLDSIVNVGMTFQESTSALSASGIKFRVLEASECGAAGDMWIDPNFVCKGGPALRLTLSDNARPYNPFYSPTMHAFLAFDLKDSLSTVVVTVEGGD